MSALGRFARFWYDFVVGDDWLVAFGVVVGVTVTALLAHAGRPAWPVMPVVVVVLLTASVWRARRRAS